MVLAFGLFMSKLHNFVFVTSLPHYQRIIEWLSQFKVFRDNIFIVDKGYCTGLDTLATKKESYNSEKYFSICYLIYL